MIDREREEELRGHYHDGYKKGRSAAKSNAGMLEQYRRGGYMCEGWADGYRGLNKGYPSILAEKP